MPNWDQNNKIPIPSTSTVLFLAVKWENTNTKMSKEISEMWTTILPLFRVHLRWIVGREREGTTNKTTWIENMTSSICSLEPVVLVRKHKLRQICQITHAHSSPDSLLKEGGTVEEYGHSPRAWAG